VVSHEAPEMQDVTQLAGWQWRYHQTLAQGRSKSVVLPREPLERQASGELAWSAAKPWVLNSVNACPVAAASACFVHIACEQIS
jgi:hypothetical protein